MKRLALAFVLSGCAPVTDAFVVDDVEVVCEMKAGCPLWEPSAVVDILDTFDELWRAAFDETPAHPARIEVPERIPLADCQFWLAWSDKPEGWAHDDVIVVAGMRASVFLEPDTTTVFHELTHNALRAATGNGDADHADGAGPWTDANDALIRKAKQ